MPLMRYVTLYDIRICVALDIDADKGKEQDARVTCKSAPIKTKYLLEYLLHLWPLNSK